MRSRPRFIKGIRDKLLVAFSVLVVAIAAFIFLFFPQRLERQALRSTVAKAAAITEMTAYSLASALLFDDEAAVTEVLVGAAAAADVAFLMVWNTSDRLIATRGSVPVSFDLPSAQPEGEISGDGRHYISTTSIVSGSRRVGTLTLGISLASLRAEVANSRRIGALAGALILVVGLLVVVGISTLVTRPLTAVAETVDRIAAGDLTLRATETSDVEVARLVQAFNRMVDTLLGAQAALAAMNVELERRVDARTAELQGSIEEQRRARAALALSEAEARRAGAQLEAVIDVVPQAIVAIDTEWRVTRWNRGAERLFGWTASEALGRPLPDVPGEEADDFLAQKLTLAASNGLEPQEVSRLRKDGTPVRSLLGIGVIRDAHDEATGYIAVFTDLTEHKRLGEQLRQSQKMDAMGRLAGGVAHDFNNILTIISTYSELMLHSPRSPEDRTQLEQIAGAAARAAALTRQLLTFTRQQVVEPRLVDSGSVVRGLEPMLRRVLPANVRFTGEVSEIARWVMADPTQLEQIVMNLVFNAADAMPDGGALRIALDRVSVSDGTVDGEPVPSGTYQLLVVEDTGTGITPEVITRMFEPFFTTKEIGKGTGLGLSTTYGIVSGLGGAIRVTSRPGHGATFRIYLPEAPAPPPGRSATAPETGPSSVGRGRGTVLLVEDEPAVRRVVKRSLERAGYAVREAGSGEEALGIAAAHGEELSAVVTDIMMPGMNGRVFAQTLLQRFPELGVVFVSGYSEASIDDAPIADARHRFLQKPFAIAHLLSAIESVTEPT